MLSSFCVFCKFYRCNVEAFGLGEYEMIDPEKEGQSCISITTLTLQAGMLVTVQ